MWSLEVKKVFFPPEFFSTKLFITFYKFLFWADGVGKAPKSEKGEKMGHGKRN